MDFHSLARSARRLGLALALAVPALQGCSSSGGVGLLDPYAVAADDGCGDDKAKLKSYRSYFFTSMLEDAGNSVAKFGSYLLAKLKAAGGDRKAAAHSLHLDLAKENAEIDGATRAFLNLRACRLRSAAAVKADLAAGRISRSDARDRLKKIHDWYLADIDFADALGAKIRDRSDEYVNASNELLHPQVGPQARTADGGAADEGSSLIAGEKARVRQEATTTSRPIATLAPGETLTALDQNSVPEGWTHVKTSDGRAGYVASRLVRQGAPPAEVTEIVQLTESQQLKRKALNNDIVRAKAEANSGAFELSGSISQKNPAPTTAAKETTQPEI